MLRKITTTALILFVMTSVSLAQKKYRDHDATTTHAFHVHQHVYVTLEDGKEVEAVIHGHVSKKKYYVRQIGTKRQGKVHEKFIRPMSDEDIAALEKRQKK